MKVQVEITGGELGVHFAELKNEHQQASMLHGLMFIFMDLLPKKDKDWREQLGKIVDASNDDMKETLRKFCSQVLAEIDGNTDELARLQEKCSELAKVERYNVTSHYCDAEKVEDHQCPEGEWMLADDVLAILENNP